MWGLSGPRHVNGIQLGWPAVSLQNAIGVVSEAVSHGASVIDTSNFYGGGRGEEILAEIHQDQLAQCRVFTKGGLKSGGCAPVNKVPRDFSAEYIQACFDESAQRLKHHAIDTYFLHGPNLDTMSDTALLSALDELKASGRIKKLGVSLRRSGLANEEYLRMIKNCSAIDVVQLPVSPLYPDLVRRLLDGFFSSFEVIGRSVYGHGILLGPGFSPHRYISADHRHGLLKDAEFAERAAIVSKAVVQAAEEKDVSPSMFLKGFALGNEALDTVLFGCSSKVQVRQNFAKDAFVLDRAEIEAFCAKITRAFAE